MALSANTEASWHGDFVPSLRVIGQVCAFRQASVLRADVLTVVTGGLEYVPFFLAKSPGA